VTFDVFRDYGEDGPRLDKLAPHLAKRMYDRNARVLMDGLSAEESNEVRGILKLAQIPLPPSASPRRRVPSAISAAMVAWVPGPSRGRCRPHR
jgi:hypothetical protein